MVSPGKISKISLVRLFVRSRSRCKPQNLITSMNWLFDNCPRTSLKIEEVEGSDYLSFFDRFGAWMDRICASKRDLFTRRFLHLLGPLDMYRNHGKAVLSQKLPFKVTYQLSFPQLMPKSRSGAPFWPMKSTPYSVTENNS